MHIDIPVFRLSTSYISPNCSLAASVNMLWFQGGSHTNSTLTQLLGNHCSHLFLLCSLVITFSPWIASVSLNEKLNPFTIVIYSAVVFLVATFHLWGTRLLVNLYNGHVATDHDFPEPVFSIQTRSPAGRSCRSSGGRRPPAPRSH